MLLCMESVYVVGGCNVVAREGMILVGSCSSQFLHTRQTIPAMLNSNYIGYKVSFIPTAVYTLMKTAE